MSEKEEKQQRRREKREERRQRRIARRKPWRGKGLHGAAEYAGDRIRFSLTLRIAGHFCVQLVRSAFMCAVIIVAIMTMLMAGFIARDNIRIAQREPDWSGRIDLEGMKTSAISASWSEEPLPESRWERWNLQVSYILRNLHPIRGTMATILRSNSPDGGRVSIVWDFSHELMLAMYALIAFVLCDLYRMTYFLRKHGRLGKRVLEPIRDITDLAATLSANNLSNRINIAGTKDELRDLAVVINTMLDRIERSYNSQKQFVSDASHELRTPIAVIQGYVNMLKRWGKEDPTVLDESLDAISQETDSMKSLVENLLFLARHDKKTMMLEIECFDASEVVDEVYREASMVTPADTFTVDTMQHGLIHADRNMIKQVLRILVDNAVKYTPEGGHISIGVVTTEQGSTFHVSDNGPGIAADVLPKIFDRFYRADEARKKENGGHGLGLSIARIIVMAHSGRIRVRTKVGEGTTFSVFIPVKPGQTDTVQEVQVEEEEPPKKRIGRKKTA